MVIGINAAAALKQPRTGAEQYVYQLIKHLTMLPEARGHRFLLYLPATRIRGFHTDDTDKIPALESPPLTKGGSGRGIFDFELPENFEVKQLSWPLPMWTQIRLASHLFLNKPDVLFIPVHVLSLVHPKNSVVAIHGLEYEYYPQMYPWRHLQYLRWSTRYAVRHARKIIAVSENTKQDLIKFYGADSHKIDVVYHGVAFPIQNAKIKMQNENSKFKINKPYLLYIGRIELKKNISGILDVYKILKEKYKIPHELVLVGPPGFGYDEIQLKVKSLKFKVLELGYVNDNDRWNLLSQAEVFLFPTFYEGFGLPILEAQSCGIPVVGSNISSVPEVVGNSALLVDPKNPEEIADAAYKLIDDTALRDKLIGLSYENVRRFSWEKCARETLQILTEL